MREEALCFGKTGSLVGIVSNPPETEGDHNFPAIILANAGLVHRVGPNRLYVKIARELAALGFVGLRFDFSGIGDSMAPIDSLSFEEKWVLEIKEAMDFLQKTQNIKRFVLGGICSGAEFSFKVACRDPRVVGLFLINSRGHLHDTTDDELDSEIEARIHARYNLRTSLSGSFNVKKWVKALTGKIDYLAVLRIQLKYLFARKEKVESGARQGVSDLHVLNERGVDLLHIYSEGDFGLDYLYLMVGDDIKSWGNDGCFKLEIVPGANHTFTLLESQKYLVKIIREWAAKNLQYPNELTINS